MSLMSLMMMMMMMVLMDDDKPYKARKNVLRGKGG